MDEFGHTMKKLFLLAASLCTAALACAQDMGRVLSSTPVMQQVAVPRQACSTEQIEVQRPNSGAGAAIGAIAGGALGSASGHGPGRAAATVIGAIGGAVLGDRIEGTPEPQFQNVQRCSMQTFFETRTVAYNVVYEYAGKQYSVQMPNDPGPHIALQIVPAGASATDSGLCAAGTPHRDAAVLSVLRPQALLCPCFYRFGRWLSGWPPGARSQALALAPQLLHVAFQFLVGTPDMQ